MSNFDLLREHSKTLAGFSNPLLCGNPLVSSQYLLPLNILSKYLPSPDGQTILDWGCGCGHFSYFLMKQGFDVSAYSYHTSEQTLQKKKLYESIFGRGWHLTSSDLSDPVRIPYADEQFHAVLSMGVLEHVAEYEGSEVASLKELYRILKPGGLLFVFHFPNKFSWIEKTTKMLHSLKILPFAGHTFLYRASDIKKLVAQTPFTLLESGLYNLFPRRMLHKIPSSLANSKVAFHAFNFLEKAAHLLLGNFAQNYFFVLRK